MRPSRAFIAFCCAVSACNNGDGGGVNAAQLTNTSSGEVALSDGGSLEFSITSDQYKQWHAAQQGLDRRIASRFGALLQPASPSERSIKRAVQYLESEPSAKAAIERAGLTVRAFVVTTVALEQEMKVASLSGTRAPDTMPLPIPYPYPYPTDTTYSTAYQTPTPYPSPYPPANPVVPAYPLPERRVDSVPRVDTVFVPVMPPARDTNATRRDFIAPLRDSILPSRDTLFSRRDSLAPKRDTAAPKRDTLAPKPPRDTLPSVPPH